MSNPNLLRSNIYQFYNSRPGDLLAASIQKDSYNQEHHQLLEQVETTRSFEQLLRVMFGNRNDLSLLDIATGAGEFPLAIAQQRRRLGIQQVVATDIDLSRLVDRRPELERLGVNLLQEDIRQEQPFGQRRFDIVTINNPIVLTERHFVNQAIRAAVTRTRRPGLVMVRIRDVGFGAPINEIPGLLRDSETTAKVFPPIFEFMFSDYPETEWVRKGSPAVAMILTDYQPRTRRDEVLGYYQSGASRDEKSCKPLTRNNYELLDYKQRFRRDRRKRF